MDQQIVGASRSMELLSAVFHIRQGRSHLIDLMARANNFLV